MVIIFIAGTVSEFISKYKRKSKNVEKVTVAMDAIERAATLKMVNLVNVLAKKQILQRELCFRPVSATGACQTTDGAVHEDQDVKQIFVTKLPICSYLISLKYGSIYDYIYSFC